jgi:glycosyltransferase involved in cell wall biosynthesis
MRKWDFKVAQRPTSMIANSSHIQKKIKEYYHRDSVVIYPPVDVEQFQKNAKNKKRDGLIIVGRQVPYKRFDLAISAAIKINKKLTVIGDGPLHKDLMRQAEGHKNITFKTGLGAEQIAKLLSESKLFLFPGIEDFGIAPVEALASGTPVVAYNQGGALDYVNIDTGLFFENQTTESLAAAVEKGLKSNWNYEQISRFSNNFSVILFDEAFRNLIKS